MLGRGEGVGGCRCYTHIWVRQGWICPITKDIDPPSHKKLRGAGSPFAKEGTGGRVRRFVDAFRVRSPEFLEEFRKGGGVRGQKGTGSCGASPLIKFIRRRRGARGR